MTRLAASPGCADIDPLAWRLWQAVHVSRLPLTDREAAVQFCRYQPAGSRVSERPAQHQPLIRDRPAIH